MIKDVEMLDRMRCIVKLYDRLSARVCEKWKINRTEMDVLAFLNNHPEFDAARDIVEIRMLPKANVSLAVESLIQKGYLDRRIDERDRRRVHLSITREAAGIVQAIEDMQNYERDVRMRGFSEEEQKLYGRMMQRICENAREELERLQKQSGEMRADRARPEGEKG